MRMILLLMSLAHGRELQKWQLGADWRAAYRTDGIPGVFVLHFVPLSALGAFARSQPAIVTVKDLSCRCNNIALGHLTLWCVRVLMVRRLLLPRSQAVHALPHPWSGRSLRRISPVWQVATDKEFPLFAEVWRAGTRKPCEVLRFLDGVFL